MERASPHQESETLSFLLTLSRVGLTLLIRGQSDCVARLKTPKPTAITFTFALHYCIFIHRAASQWGLSGMTGGDNAFCLKDGWRSRINRIWSLLLQAKNQAECRNYSIREEIKASGEEIQFSLCL